MSADTTIVIAAHDESPGKRKWSVAVVQSAEYLLEEQHDYGLKKAQDIFFRPGQFWYSELSNAKKVAAVMAEDLNTTGGLEYQKRVVILITDTGVELLSAKKGLPMPKGSRILLR